MALVMRQAAVLSHDDPAWCRDLDVGLGPSLRVLDGGDAHYASEGSDRVAGLVVLHHHPALPAHPDPLEIGEDTWYLRRSEVPVVAIGLRTRHSASWSLVGTA